MALRNQPYIPLYVQDFLTDEKLVECSAESTGVYIRLLCVMHKSDEYGIILLNQKYKQTDKQVENFACKLAKHMPYTTEVIHRSLHELINEEVLALEDCKLLQKRMIRDNNISEKRSKAGSIGGRKTQFAKANVEANSEYETANETANESINEVVKEIIDDLNLVCSTSYKSKSAKTRKLINTRLNEGFTVEDFKTVHRKKAIEWSTDNKMIKFLRPETLYSNKFEGYLNQKEVRTLTQAQQATAESLRRFNEQTDA